ncbi:type IV pilus modification protein PilV [Lysobacter sp. CA199]|uniref:type IV pilus modification protein PilV n=1 Tax=Lysobacter sp. CA199 TaxID=3455608 RepID=UPI003F8D01C4
MKFLRRAQSGFTLLELLVTVTVAAIILALAVPNLIATINRSRLTGAATELVASLQTARMEAIRRNARITVCRSDNQTVCATGSGRWNGWIVVMPDANRDGVANDPAVLHAVQLKSSVQMSSALTWGASVLSPRRIRTRRRRYRHRVSQHPIRRLPSDHDAGAERASGAPVFGRAFVHGLGRSQRSVRAMIRRSFIPVAAQRCRREPRGRKRQSGVGLIEILVAVLVLGLGLLGVAAMQSLALRNSQSSMQRSQAVVQAYAMADAMRANPTAASAGAYDTGGLQCFGEVKPEAGSLAAADRAAWLQSLGKSLGENAKTCGQVACKDSLCTIEVRWDDSRGANAGGEKDADKQTFSMQVRL